jgi:hypothetical protein
LRTKKLRERRQKKLVINRWLHKKEGILGRPTKNLKKKLKKKKQILTPTNKKTIAPIFT